MQLASLSKRLVNAHLEAASFYQDVAKDPDSAFIHIQQASEVPDYSADHWRAVVQYGMILQDRNPGSTEANELLMSAATNDAVPRGIQNAARDLVGLPQVAKEKTEQEIALEGAERMLLSGNPIDSVLDQYVEVAAMDSHSFAGSQALQAIAYLQEYQLTDYSNALATHQAIIELFPDSQFVAISKAKVSEPDTTSIFLMSDKELEGSFQPAMDLLTSESDSTGWPPEESSLLGRRFR